MKILVTVKQVPDTSGKVAVNPDGTLDRASMQTIINPDDMNAVEAALAMKDEYEKDMADARNKASEILSVAQKTASDQSERMIQEAAAQAAALKAKAESDIAQEKRKAVNEAKNEIGGMAMEIAGKVIEREINEEDHKKLIDDFIANVGEAS